MFEERNPIGRKAPRAVYVLRFVALAALVLVVVTTVTTAPDRGDGPHGHLLVGIGLGVFIAGSAMVFYRRPLPAGFRFGGLLALALGSAALLALQPDTPAVAGTYLAAVIGSLRLKKAASILLTCIALGTAALAYSVHPADAVGNIVGLLFSVIPWIVVVNLMRELYEGRDRAEQLVEELRESQEAQAEAAAETERGRVARDMHDVLAHTLSALALQLESARLVARDRDADPEVIGALERAHHLAAGGLDEARRAIGALRGEALLGPDGLSALADAFRADAGVPCELAVSGEPLALCSEARLAIYRTTQEALTNVRRHAAPDCVTIDLGYEDDGARLVVEDAGAAVPVATVASPGGGFGLTGMRERAELLGATLTAGPTDRGFRVELWVPVPA